ncbi:MAG: hypothetical protein J6A17_01135 [Bacilli bacterium]|nr:hypothetical protein [Bacilli bacterium]
MDNYKELLIKYRKLEIEISNMTKEEAELKKEELVNLKQELEVARKNKLQNEIQNTLDKMRERRNI